MKKSGRYGKGKGPGPDLVELTRRAFAAEGPIYQVMRDRGIPFKVEPAQALYAEAVAETFMEPHDPESTIGLLEGETGVGKTLAYLVVLSLHASLGLGRGLVSTHTRQLQRQILESELPIAAEVVRRMTGRLVLGAARHALGSFVSADRVVKLRDALLADDQLDLETARYLDGLEAHAADDGVMLHFIADWGPLPARIDEADVVLLSGTGEDAAAYRRHLEGAVEADIVVVTHAMLVRSLHQWNTNVLGPRGEDGLPPFRVGIVDEAEHLKSAAASLFTFKVTLSSIAHAAGEAPGEAGAKLAAELAHAQDWFNSFHDIAGRHGLLSYDRGADLVDLSMPDAEPFRKKAGQVAMRLSRALAKYPPPAANGKEPDLGAHSPLLRLADSLAQFDQACKKPSENSCPVLRWSPVRTMPGFSVVPLRPGRLAMRLWIRPKSEDGGRLPPFLKGIVMTSATLDAPGGAGGREFLSFKNEVGLWGKLGEIVSTPSLWRKFAPKRFGKMTFVLPDPSSPHPTSKQVVVGETVVSTNPAWCDYVVSAFPGMSDGCALVLTTSFRDTAAMAERGRAIGLETIIEHRRGQSLTECIELLKHSKNGILLSPAAWSGVNLPGVLSHLVIPRLPFVPPDQETLRMRLATMAAGGLSVAHAKRILQTADRYDALRKLRQGIGRGIRCPTDQVVLWILDPRFPLPDAVADAHGIPLDGKSDRNLDFLHCIPTRFTTGLGATFYRAGVHRFNLAEAAE